MDKVEYRPKVIQFVVAPDDSHMPETLGEFKNADEVSQFIKDNLVAMNMPVTVGRHMDAVEKRDIREKYHDVLENQLPRLESAHSDKNQILSDAKTDEKAASERVNAAITEARLLAKDVRRGTKDINLDEVFTYRVPYHGRYYFFSFMDGELKLCKIGDIPEKEKSEIFNNMSANEAFINEKFGEPVESQEG